MLHFQFTSSVLHSSLLSVSCTSPIFFVSVIFWIFFVSVTCLIFFVSVTFNFLRQYYIFNFLRQCYISISFVSFQPLLNKSFLLRPGTYLKVFKNHGNLHKKCIFRAISCKDCTNEQWQEMHLTCCFL